MEYFIGIDLGTSAVKAALYGAGFALICEESRDYPMHQPQNGWAEQDPGDWWRAVKEALSSAAGRAGVTGEDRVTVGLTGQMHGLVMLDSENRVLRPAILWCDQRTGEQCREITERVGAERLIEITANPALTGFTAAKLLWVRRHEPELYSRCTHILLPKDYIRFLLTGDFATDVTDASGMQLLDVPNRRWSGEVLEKLDVNPALLPRVYESQELTGELLPDIAAELGLPAGTRTAAGAGDCAAGAVGTGIVEDSRAMTTIGSSGVVYTHTDRFRVDPKGRVHTFCAPVPGTWHVMGVTQGAGLSLKWFKDRLCSDYVEKAASLGLDPYVLMDRDAAEVPAGAGGLLYLPYLMGERTPHLDPDARGVFFGLSAIHEKKHLIRAVMEGVSFSLLDCLSVFGEMGVSVGGMTAAGGGATSRLWRQMLADMYGLPVTTTASPQGSARGAAILAAVAAGAYPSVREACRSLTVPGESCPPVADSSARYRKLYPIYRGLYTSLRPSFAELAACH